MFVPDFPLIIGLREGAPLNIARLAFRLIRSYDCTSSIEWAYPSPIDGQPQMDCNK